MTPHGQFTCKLYNAKNCQSHIAYCARLLRVQISSLVIALDDLLCWNQNMYNDRVIREFLWRIQQKAPSDLCDHHIHLWNGEFSLFPIANQLIG